MSFALEVFAKSTVILTIAALLSISLRRASASLRHAVWMLALVAAALLPFAMSFVPNLWLDVVPKAVTNTSVILRGALTDGPMTATMPERPVPTVLQRLQPIFLWYAGIAIVVVRFTLATFAARRITRGAIPVSGGYWNQLVQDVGRRVELKAPVRIALKDAPISPMTQGIFRHTILLPTAANNWPEERCRMVLAHELGHIKRNDGLMQVFVRTICAVYWFNPLVWFAAHRIRIERERACDDQVLQLGTEPADYAEHLIEIVRGIRRDRAISATAMAMAQPSQLETRLVSILDSQVRRRTASPGLVISLCMLTAAITASLAAVQLTAAPPVPFLRIAALAAPMPQQTRMENESAPNDAFVPPKVIAFSAPEYTDEAVLAKIEGVATVEADVDEKGTVTVLRIVKGLGYGLDKNAMDAVVVWKFQPALRNGAPVRSVTLVDVEFRIPPWFKTGPKETGIPIGPGVTPPTVISRVAPRYPESEKANGKEGTVIVLATVNSDGSVIVNEVTQELGPEFDKNTIEAIEQWKFEAAKKDGKAVAVIVKIEANFTLK